MSFGLAAPPGRGLLHREFPGPTRFLFGAVLTHLCSAQWPQQRQLFGGPRWWEKTKARSPNGLPALRGTGVSPAPLISTLAFFLRLSSALAAQTLGAVRKRPRDLRVAPLSLATGPEVPQPVFLLKTSPLVLVAWNVLGRRA